VNDCPMCEGSPEILGTLGKVTWLRCRHCGWEYQATEPIETDEDEEDYDESDLEDEEDFDA